MQIPGFELDWTPEGDVAVLSIVGRVAMDHCAVDVTDLPQARTGDEVVVPVRRLAVPPDVPRVMISDEEE